MRPERSHSRISPTWPSSAGSATAGTLPEATASRRPSGEKATDQIGPWWSARFARSRPVATSQSVTERLSPLAVASVSPSGEKAIASSLPLARSRGRPRASFKAHNVTAPNGAPSKPVPRPATAPPSGANATASTSSQSPRSVRLSSSRPPRTSQSLMVPSQPPLARVRPSGEKATDVTTLL